MFLSLIGFIIIIIAAVTAYSTAKQYERNAALWAGLVVLVGIGVQWILPIIGVVAVGLIMLASGYSETDFQQAILGPATIISVVCLILSVVAMLLILKYLSSGPVADSDSAPPKPPEFFN
ncbi:MAG: hypothetical protein KIS76_14235 [Pyrinomonadaceae bacterium]|nr:hypothetical protein [Pyrinomonadaceae bacterium]